MSPLDGLRRLRVGVAVGAALVVALTVASLRAESARAPMALIDGGTYRPFYPATPKEREVAIRAFRLDKLPVTNADFLAFVRRNPKWRRDRVEPLFADAHYLEGWKGPLDLGPSSDPLQPVVGVSWFAAKAYCAARGARLPREAEWEYAASASRILADGRNDSAFREEILAWYARPNPGSLPRVGSRKPNFWGVSDLHGLVWEWVLDYNSTLVTGDNRESGDKDKMRFCGVGALGADDTNDYASFMRFAFRSSLRADSTTKNLGFRCAADAPKVPQ